MTVENPNYVLKMNDAIIVKECNRRIESAKWTVWICIIAIIFTAIWFGESVTQIVNWQTLVLLAIGFILFGFYKPRVSYFPIPLEIQFYDDRLCVYYPQRYYDSEYVRREIYDLQYSQISKCVYKTKSKKLVIRGNGNLKFYKRKNGVIPDEPTLKKIFTNRKIKINTHLAENVNFQEIIEAYSPLNVKVSNM